MIATGLSPDGVRSVTCAVCCARTIDVTARSAMSVKTRLRFMSRETAAHYRMRAVGSRAMRRTVVFLAVLLAISCGQESTQRTTFDALSTQPASVRGWIRDAETRNASAQFRPVPTDAHRRP